MICLSVSCVHRKRTEFFELAKNSQFVWEDEEHRDLLRSVDCWSAHTVFIMFACTHVFHTVCCDVILMCRSMLMTACDISAITKPWPVQKRVRETRSHIISISLSSLIISLVWWLALWVKVQLWSHQLNFIIIIQHYWDLQTHTIQNQKNMLALSSWGFKSHLNIPFLYRLTEQSAQCENVSLQMPGSV